MNAKKGIIGLILLIGLNLSAQGASEIKARTQIENIVQILTDAWAKGDAELFASAFSEDADFTVWFGMKRSGQKEIAFGHTIIFKDFHATTDWDLKIDKIRFVGEEIALVHCSRAVLQKEMSVFQNLMRFRY